MANTDEWTSRLYFIISSPRSGSSLLRNKLNDYRYFQALPSDMRIVEFCLANRKIFNDNQSAFRKQFQEKYETRQGKALTEIQWSEFANQSASNLQEFFYQVFELWSNAPVKPIFHNSLFVEKSPSNIYYIKEIKRLFPRAKLIYLHKDPRDVVSSLNSIWWASHNTFINSKKWAYEQSRMLNSYDYKVSYENLVDDPENELINLLNHLNYPDLKEVQLQRAIDLTKDPNSIAEPGRAIHSGNKMKFKLKLSKIDREVEIVESVCAREMTALGYDRIGTDLDFQYYRKRFFLSLEFYVNRAIALIKGRREY